ncbi:hypothetical protein AAMO2058_000747100 [Amorphochlora amoebiformis]
MAYQTGSVPPPGALGGYIARHSALLSVGTTTPLEAFPFGPKRVEIPTHVVGKVPPNSALQRGYIARFRWREHYVNRFDPASFAQGQSLAIGPDETELVPSIPTIFHRILIILQEVEKANRNRDILENLDRKIVRHISEVTSASRSLDRKLILNNFGGHAYVINACRKEHVKLIYEGIEGTGLLESLGLCAQLIDVYAISPGRTRHCVGGFGMRCQSSLVCTCSGQAKTLPFFPKTSPKVLGTGEKSSRNLALETDLYHPQDQSFWANFDKDTDRIRKCVFHDPNQDYVAYKDSKIECLRDSIVEKKVRLAELEAKNKSEAIRHEMLIGQLKALQEKMYTLTNRMAACQDSRF